MKGIRKIVSVIAWPACAARCDHCGKRRLTYQLREGECNDRMCSPCLIRRFKAEGAPAVSKEGE